jgi:hypothetical protein
LYVAGSFKKKITFGSTTLNAPSPSADAFLAKISVNGFKLEDSHHTSLQMEVYPIPASDILTINSTEEGSFDAQVFSEDGKLVMTKEFAFTGNSTESLDISSLLPGNYILYLTQDGKNSVTKFLKQ